MKPNMYKIQKQNVAITNIKPNVVTGNTLMMMYYMMMLYYMMMFYFKLCLVLLVYIRGECQCYPSLFVLPPVHHCSLVLLCTFCCDCELK